MILLQAHRYSRTRDLYDDFANVLEQVDVLILLDVYSAGEKPIAGADGRSLSRTIRGRGKIDPIFVADINTLPSVLANVIQGGDLVLTQGAGDVGRVAKQLESLQLDINKMKDVHCPISQKPLDQNVLSAQDSSGDLLIMLKI